MVATDTVIGIVGAVVLVAVMASVFVYEYNNAPEEADTPEALQAHFEEDYAGLSALDDIDGDDQANYLDDDLDGDGTPNAEDDAVGVLVDVQGNVAAATGTSGAPYTQEFTVGNGTFHMMGSIAYGRTNGNVAVPSLQAVLTGPEGFALSATSTVSGNTVTLAFALEEPLVAGDYTLTISHAPAGGLVNVSPQTGFAGSLELHYLTPAEPHGHDA